jgi:hypothetical protein
MWPTPQQVIGLGAWGGVAVGTLLYLVQPFDAAKKALGLGAVAAKKE